MSTQISKKLKGFTIIEVMIVLAIAGVIMLAVFLAVPALQRNSRNSQRKNDVSSILGSVSEYISNNGGQLPVASGAFNTEFSNANPKLGFYTAANVTYNYSATARGSAPAMPASNDQVVVYNYLKCSSATAATTTGASSKSLAALYLVETSGNNLGQCQES